MCLHGRQWVPARRPEKPASMRADRLHEIFGEACDWLCGAGGLRAFELESRPLSDISAVPDAGLLQITAAVGTGRNRALSPARGHPVRFGRPMFIGAREWLRGGASKADRMSARRSFGRDGRGSARMLLLVPVKQRAPAWRRAALMEGRRGRTKVKASGSARTAASSRVAA